jgi:hypothetical protein
MVGGKRAAYGVLGLSLALLGCVGLPRQGAVFPEPPSPARPRPAAVPQAASELRIPDEAVARRPDIPLVPVPPPPVGRPPAPQPAAPPPAPPVIATTPSPPAAPPAVPAVPLRQLYRQAAERYAGIDSYIVRLTRREQVRGKNQPEEVILFKFRKEPWSLYFKWLGPAGQGREVVYVKGQYENKIHTLLAAGDHPLMAAGNRIALPVDSILVRSASRHPITAAGIGASIDRIGALLDARDRGDQRPGTLNDLGLQTREEFPHPLDTVEHVIPPGVEPELPRGGRRLYYFDPESHLPVLVQARDDRGQEVEYYRYDRFQYPVKLDNDDFDPDKLWARPKGR